jgi:AraC-like DNA-binding protein
LQQSLMAQAAYGYQPGRVGSKIVIARKRILDLVDGMRSEPAAEFSTARCADALGIDAVALVRDFRRVTGVSPMRFRCALRMDLAKRLLVETGGAVTDVAFTCGYSSVGTFVRSFSLMVGMPPSAFRDAARSGMPGIATFLSTTPFKGRCVCGTIPDPQPSRPMVVATGLFKTAVPAGLPIAGQILLNGGRFVLPCPSEAPVLHLLGFAVPAEASLWRVSASQEIHVFSKEIHGLRRRPVTVVEPRWRRLTQADPPVVAALPALLDRVAKLQSERSAAAAQHV